MDEFPTVPPNKGESDLDPAEHETLPPTTFEGAGHQLFSDQLDESGEGMSGAQRLRSYADAEEIGCWQYGHILEAKHPRLKRWVRIAVLDPAHVTDTAIRERFLSTIRKLATLVHPNVESRVWEAVADDATVFVVLERVRSRPITQFGPRTLEEKQASWFYPNHELARRMLEAWRGLIAIRQHGISVQSLDASNIRINDENDQTVIGFPTEFKLTETTGSGLAAECRRLLSAAFVTLASGEAEEALPLHSTEALDMLLAKRNPELAFELRQLLVRSICHGGVDPAEEDHTLGDFTNTLHKYAAHVPSAMRINDRGGTYTYNLFFAMAVAIALFVSCMLMGVRPGLTVGLFVGVVYALLLQSDELIFGTAVGRRLRGFRLMDRTGRTPRLSMRLSRYLLRALCVLVVGGLVELGLRYLAPSILDKAGMQFPFLITGIVGLAGPYLTCVLTRSGRPIYDELTGTTIASIQKTRPFADDGLPLEGQASSGEFSTMALTPAERQLDQYAISREIGRGGMGAVYVARDTTLNRTVAIKTISSALVHQAEAVARFEQEARLAAQLKHENVAEVFGVGGGSASPYLVMEYVRGRSLAELANGSVSMTVDDAWKYITQAARGLKAAQKLGIIHRDIKPANLMLETKTGTIKVMDFGLSKLAADDSESPIDVDQATIDESLISPELTRAGAMLGTPMYMSPEQASGNPVDARSDIYSLGMTLYFLLAGKPPFKPDTTVRLIIKQCSEMPRSVRSERPEVTADQEYVLERMIAKDPADRYADYDALIEHLDAAAPAPLKLASHSARLGAVVGSSICLGLASFVIQSSLVGLGVLQSVDPQETVFTWNRYLIETALVAILIWLPLWKWGQTPGKRWAQTRVVRLDGNPITLWQATVRCLLHPSWMNVLLGPIQIYFAQRGVPQERLEWFLYPSVLILFAVSIFMIFRLKSRRALHDFAAGTQVVSVGPRLLVR